MRGSDTLKFQISRLNGTNRNVCHSSKTAFINQPFAAPHQSAGSEVPSDSFPPGEAKEQLRKLVPFIERLNPVRLRADAIRPYSHGGRAADGSTYSLTPTVAYSKYRTRS